MDFNNLFNQFTGFIPNNVPQKKEASNDALGSLVSNIPNGLVGGAAAGSIMALLMGSRSTRGMTAKVAGYGGAALLGGLAYKACKNWQYKNQYPHIETANNEAPIVYDKGLVRKSLMTQDLEIKLIKVMIASTKADGHIDASEQRRIFQAIDHMDLSIEIRAALFNLLNKPIDINALTCDVEGIHQKSVLYLAAYLVSEPELPRNKLFMNQLAASLGLPEDLQQQLALQGSETLNEEI